MIMGNDEFILYIRKRYPDCSLENRTIGRQVAAWLRDNGGETIVDPARPCLWGETGVFVSERWLPQAAAQFEFDMALLPTLYAYLDHLGEH